LLIGIVRRKRERLLEIAPWILAGALEEIGARRVEQMVVGERALEIVERSDIDFCGWSKDR
jgi:hypothetical protein